MHNNVAPSVKAWFSVSMIGLLKIWAKCILPVNTKWPICSQETSNHMLQTLITGSENDQSSHLILFYIISSAFLTNKSQWNMQIRTRNEAAQLRSITRLAKISKNGDNDLLGLKSKGNDPSSQWGRGRGACVGVGAFWLEVCSHLRKRMITLLNLTATEKSWQCGKHA